MHGRHRYACRQDCYSPVDMHTCVGRAFDNCM